MRPLRNRIRRLRHPQPLPSLYDRYPHAASATRRMRGVQIVPVDKIVGTTRQPSQVTEDFLPLPELRGQNWRARWQRIRGAVDRLAVLPPVDLIQVGDEYFISDGHNRVAAAREAGMVGIDADVVELIVPGVEPSSPATATASGSLVEARALRSAGEGRLSPTAEPHLVPKPRTELLADDAEEPG